MQTLHNSMHLYVLVLRLYCTYTYINPIDAELSYQLYKCGLVFANFHKDFSPPFHCFVEGELIFYQGSSSLSDAL